MNKYAALTIIFIFSILSLLFTVWQFGFKEEAIFLLIAIAIILFLTKFIWFPDGKTPVRLYSLTIISTTFLSYPFWLPFLKSILTEWFGAEIADLLYLPSSIGVFLFVLLGVFIVNFFMRDKATETNPKWFENFRFRRPYNQNVIFEHRVFNVRGLRTQGTFMLKLEKVFVELRIAHAHKPQQASVNPVFAKTFTNSHPIWDFLNFNKKHQSDDTLVLGVIGAPGCGKTTLLQHIALILATQQHRRYKMSAYIPLLLFLRQHVKTIVESAPNLADLAYTHFSNCQKYPDLNPPPNWFAQQLTNGKCIILLDGLDEVADLLQRRKVSAWVDQQIKSYHRCRFIVTSRPQGYLTAPVAQANVLEVQPFNAEQVRRFVHAWYLENEVISFRGLDEGIRNGAKQKSEDLLRRLKETPSLNALTVNPLLLTMIAMVHRYRGQLPGRRVELYSEICDVLLGHWQKAKGLDVSLTAAQKRVALQPLAAIMMLRKWRDISTDHAVQMITKPLKRVGYQSIPSFLNDVQAGSGLFFEGEIGEWSFAHLTFQEYLAATYFLEKQSKLDWKTIINESWWHETLLLYAAQGDATRLVQACLDNNNVTSLTLAADFLEEARELDETVREQVEIRLIDALESDDPQRRQLAAKVRLSQRLKSLQRIDEQREIDLDYITCAEYQLFLDDKRAEDEYYQPDHWTVYTFQKGTAQEPIRGVRAKDVEEFCAWLTQRQEGDVRYRLPLPSEVMDYQPKIVKDDLAAWCKEGNIFSLKGLQKENQNILLKKAGILERSSLQFDLDFGRTRAKLRALDFPLPNDIALALALARDRDRDIALALARDRDIARASLARSLARSRSRAHAHALDLARDLASNKIYQAIGGGNLQVAKHLIQAMQNNETDFVQQQFATLLYELLTCVTAATALETRQAWRQYLLSMTKYVLVSVDKSKTLYFRSEILNLHTWLKIIIAREKGQLPAWEGIRIVREQL